MLRRARMGNRAKQTFPNDPRGVGIPDEDVVMEDVDNKPPPVEEDRTYTVRRWIRAKVEKPDVKLLADRRPGLPPLYGVTGYTEAVNVPAKKMVKVRTTDSVTGQQRIFDTMILEGGESTVDGEIITEEEAAAALAASNSAPENADSTTPTVVAETLAPGTVVEGVGVVNEEGVVVAPAVTAAAAAIAEATPVRRRPPPPKRKKHGPGRGRKKKVMFAPGQGVEVSGAGTAFAQQAPAAVGTNEAAAAPEGTTRISLDGANEDREDSNLPDEGDDESGDEEEGSEEGEIEEDGDDGPTENASQTVHPPEETSAVVEKVAEQGSQQIAPEPVTSTTEQDATTTEAPVSRQIHPLPPKPVLVDPVPKEPADVPMDKSEAESTPAINSEPERPAEQTEEPAVAPVETDLEEKTESKAEEVETKVEEIVAEKAEEKTEDKAEGKIEEVVEEQPEEKVEEKTEQKAEEEVVQKTEEEVDQKAEENAVPIVEAVTEEVSATKETVVGDEMDLLGSLEKTLDDEDTTDAVRDVPKETEEAKEPVK